MPPEGQNSPAVDKSNGDSNSSSHAGHDSRDRKQLPGAQQKLQIPQAVSKLLCKAAECLRQRANPVVRGGQALLNV
jgi:hypothetical protein